MAAYSIKSVATNASFATDARDPGSPVFLQRQHCSGAATVSLSFQHTRPWGKRSQVTVC